MNPLFETSIVYDFDTYKRLSAFAAKKINKFAQRVIAADICILLLAYISYRTGAMTMAIAFIISAVAWPFVAYFKQKKNVKKAWDSAPVIHDTVYSYKFFEDKMTVNTPNGEANVKYGDIFKVIEDDEFMMIMVSGNRGYLLKKENCSPDLVLFVQNLAEGANNRKNK